MHCLFRESYSLHKMIYLLLFYETVASPSACVYMQRIIHKASQNKNVHTLTLAKGSQTITSRQLKSELIYASVPALAPLPAISSSKVQSNGGDSCTKPRSQRILSCWQAFFLWSLIGGAEHDE